MAERKESSAGWVRKPWEEAKAGGGSATDPVAMGFVESVSLDWRLYKQDIAGSLAHARMLKRAGLISAGDLRRIERGLKEIEGEIDREGAKWKGWRKELEDVHMCIEAALIERVGEAGRKLHTGRSRNDQVAVDLLLWLDWAGREIEKKLKGLCGALVGLAERSVDVVMPGYTHWQRAQPIVAAAEALAWCQMFWEDLERGRRLRREGWRSPLGSGAVAGSALALDAGWTARALGFAGPPANSVFETSQRDAAVEFVFHLAMIGMHLSRLAEQWIVYMSWEFGFLSIGEAFTTGSSMMPQKRNPDMLELIRGRSGAVLGHLVGLLTVCKGLPIGYSRDLQEDKRHVFSAFDLVMEELEMARRIVRSARFERERIARGLGEGFLDATAAAEYLVRRGIAFRTAHQIVGRLVRKCQEEGRKELRELRVEEFNAACRAAGEKEVVGEDVYEWLGAENVVRRYATAGNAGRSGVRVQLAKWKRRLGGKE